MPLKKPATKKKTPAARRVAKKKIVKRNPPLTRSELKTLDQLEKELTPAQVYFCQRLIFRMGIVARAYKDVFPNADIDTSKYKGAKWLADVNVHSYYSLLKQQTAAEYKIDTEWILEKHKEVVEADLLELYDSAAKQNFKLKHIKDFPKKYRWLIQSIAPSVAGIKITLLDKQKALIALGSIAGIDQREKNTASVGFNLSFDKDAEGF